MMGSVITLASWTSATAPLFRNAVANITWSNWIPASPSAEQLLLGITVTGVVNAIVHLQWSPDNGTTIYDEIVEAPGALAAGEQRYTCNTKAWGPIVAGSTAPLIERPVGMTLFRVGVYSDGVPAAGDAVAVKAVLARGFALQSVGS